MYFLWRVLVSTIDNIFQKDIACKVLIKPEKNQVYKHQIVLKNECYKWPHHDLCYCGVEPQTFNHLIYQAKLKKAKNIMKYIICQKQRYKTFDVGSRSFRGEEMA